MLVLTFPRCSWPLSTNAELQLYRNRALKTVSTKYNRYKQRRTAAHNILQRAIAALSENLHALKAADMVRDTAHHYSARILLEFGRLIQVMTQKDEGNTQLQV